MCQYTLFTYPLENAEFSESLWKSLKFSDQGEPIPMTKETKCLRGGMVGDLQDHYLTAGMSEVEVKNILGEPNFVPYHTAGCIGYWLGYCTGMRIDTQSLDVCFDVNDKLIAANVYEH